MKKKLSFLSVFVFLSCFNTYPQHFDVGVKLDLFKIVWLKQLPPYEGVRSVPVHSMATSPAIFLKLGFLPVKKFELELNGGYQFGDKFTGLETAIMVKYEVWNNISPFVAYFNHADRENVGTGSINIYNYVFFGAGAEWRLTKIFSVDIGYYYPVGEKGFDYRNNLSDHLVFTEEISSFLKLGIIFSFYH